MRRPSKRCRKDQRVASRTVVAADEGSGSEDDSKEEEEDGSDQWAIGGG